MDTASESVQRARQRLKKVLKKNRTGVPTQNLYLKRLKSAISLSLNSTQSMKALQANNKLLAVSLEKMRRNFHQVHTHYTYLLEWNHELRQKVIELERYKKDMETFILMEANKRYEERMQEMKKKILVLSSHAAGVLEILTELSEMCFSKNFTSSICSLDLTSSDSSPPFMSDYTSMTDGASFNQTGADDSEVGGHTELEFGSARKKNETSLNICSSLANISTVSSECGSRSTSSTSVLTCKQNPSPKSPVPDFKWAREQELLDSKLVGKPAANLRKRMGAEVAEKMKKQTFIVTSNSLPDGGVISDIVMPQFLEIDCHDDKCEWMEAHSPEKFACKPEASQVISYVDMVQTKKHNQLIVKSKTRSPIPQKKLNSQTSENTGKQTSAKIFLHRKPVSRTNKKKNTQLLTPSSKVRKNSTKCWVKAENKKQNLSNESDLSFTPLHKLPASDNKLSYITTVQRLRTVEQHPVFEPLEIAHLVKTGGVQEHFGRLEEGMPEGSITDADETETELTRICDHNSLEQGEQSLCERDEKIPDTGTMRFARSGQSAIRKMEHDGTTRNVLVIDSEASPKIRKQLLNVMEDSPLLKAQPKFDFCEKSPNAKRQKVTQMVEKVVDKFSSLPPMSPNKNYPRARNTKRIIKSVSQVGNNTTEEENHDLQASDLTFEDPVIGSFTTAELCPQTGSDTHSWKLNEYDARKGDTGAHTMSGKKLADSCLENQASVVRTNQLLKAQEQFVSITSETNIQVLRPVANSNEEWASPGGKSEGPAKNSHLNSDAVGTQKELNRQQETREAHSASVKPMRTNTENTVLKTNGLKQLKECERQHSSGLPNERSSMLFHSVPACEFKVRRLSEERVTRLNADSANSDVELLKDSCDTLNLMDEIKYQASSVASTVSVLNVVNLQTSQEVLQHGVGLNVTGGGTEERGAYNGSSIRAGAESKLQGVNGVISDVQNRTKKARSMCVPRREELRNGSDNILGFNEHPASRTERPEGSKGFKDRKTGSGD